MKGIGSVEQFFRNSKFHIDQLKKLRALLLQTELEEKLKWGMPVYCLGNKNVVGIGSFKAYYGLWFYQGAFLKDHAKVLLNAQEGKTKAMRQWRFREGEPMDEKLILSYLSEAIENQKAGLEIKAERITKPLVLPDELQDFLQAEEATRLCFEKLSLSVQREYAEYIAVAKKADTKMRRLEKIKNTILEGKSLNHKYK